MPSYGPGYAGLNSTLPVRSIQTDGAACDGVLVHNATIAGGSLSTLTSSSGLFTAAHVGKVVLVDGAGVAGATLSTTISSFTSSTSVGLAVAASTAVSGALAVWGTDDTAAFNTAWTNLNTAGGGTLFVPGVCICLGQLVQPFDSTTLENSPIAITGRGGWGNGSWSSKVLGTGSVLVLASATGPAKIDARGNNELEFARITVLSIANDGNPILQTTNPILKVRSTTAWCGRPSQTQGACTQDAIILGGAGSSVTGNGSNAPFQGYGTEIESCYFDNVRRGVWARTFANNVFVNQPTFSASCGSTNVLSVTDGAMTAASNALVCATSTPFTSGMVNQIIAVEGAGDLDQGSVLVATITAFTDSGHVTLSENALTTVSNATVIAPSGHAIQFGTSPGTAVFGVNGCLLFAPLIETPHYAIPVAITNSSQGNHVLALSVWDGTGVASQVGGVFTDATSSANMITVAQNNQGTNVPSVVEEKPGANTVVNPNLSVPITQFSNNVLMKTNRKLRMLAGSGLYFGLGAVSADDVTVVRNSNGDLVFTLNNNANTLFKTICQSAQIGPTTNFVATGSLGTSDAWVDAEGSLTNINLQLRSKGTGVVNVNSNMTMVDAKNFAVGTGTGTKIGTSTTQKLSFYNSTPVVQPAGTVDVLASLVTLGLRAASSNPPLNLGTGTLTAGKEVTRQDKTSGALSTISLSSGTGAQVDTTSDRFLVVSVTYTLVASTIAVALSPDNVTYSTLVTKNPGVAGDVDSIDLLVPAGWYVKLTATNATIGTGTYY